MDKLTKSQKDEYATAFAILALYDGGVSLKLKKEVAHDQFCWRQCVMCMGLDNHRRIRMGRANKTDVYDI